MTSDKNNHLDRVSTPATREALGKDLTTLARENAIPLDEDFDLTGRLAQVAPPDQIPERVYSGVAALLTFLRDAEEAAEDV